MTLNLRRLNPVIGIEASGVQATPDLSDDTFASLYRAWLESGGLLVMRDQHLTPDDQIAFSRRFGELDPLTGQTVEPYLLPGHPEIYRVSNKVADGKQLGRQRAGTYWHSDNSHKERAAKASLLYGIEVPEYGGDTLFAGMAAAWQALSPTLRDILKDLRCVHDFEKAKSGSFKNETVTDRHMNTTPAIDHPLVRTHPETGAKCLFLNAGVVTHFVGMTAEESAPLLEYLYRHCTRAELVYRHRWQVNDLLIWDNRAAMHYAVADYDGVGDRYMHRTTVFGDRPV